MHLLQITFFHHLLSPTTLKKPSSFNFLETFLILSMSRTSFLWRQSKTHDARTYAMHIYIFTFSLKSYQISIKSFIVICTNSIKWVGITYLDVGCKHILFIWISSQMWTQTTQTTKCYKGRFSNTQQIPCMLLGCY